MTARVAGKTAKRTTKKTSASVRTSTKTTTTSTITRTTRRAASRIELPGGTVVLVESSRAVPLVGMTIALRGGSAHDPEGAEGALRVALRMIRRGGGGMTAREIEDALDRLASEIGFDVGVSSATISGQVIARNVDAYVDLVAKLLAEPAWDPSEFGLLQRETEAELVESRDNDRALAQRAFRRAMFAGHPYGRGAAGTIRSVKALTIPVVSALYAKMVRKKNLVIAFSGDLDLDDARAFATRLVAGIPSGGGLKDVVPEPERVPGRRLVFVDKPERTQTQLAIGTLGTSPHDPDHAALEVANAVFGGSFTSRLVDEVRSKRGWTYGAGSRLSVDRKRHAFSMWTAPKQEQCADCIELEIGLLETWTKEGITDEELAFIKKFLVRSNALEIDTAWKRVHRALDVEVLGLPADYYSGFVKRVEKVTAKQAGRAAKNRISTDDLVVVVVGTASDVLAKIEAKFPTRTSTTVVPYDAD